MQLISEYVTCPHCWERIELTLDTSVAEQRYTEDCYVCCHPISIRYVIEAGALVELETAAEGA